MLRLLLIVIPMFLSYSATARTSIETRLQRLEKSLDKSDALSEQYQEAMALVRNLELKLDEQNTAKLMVLEHRVAELHDQIKDLNVKLQQQQDFINSVLTVKKTNNDNKVPAKIANDSEPHSEQVKFQYCMHLVKNKKLDEALVAFEDFIWQFPSGSLAASAHFWMAELHLLRWTDDHKNINARDEAIKQFKFVYSRFNDNPKAPDALLKLGLIMYEDGHLIKSKELLHDLINKFPGTSAARIAEAKLKAFNKRQS